jgi:hypothetical protein
LLIRVDPEPAASCHEVTKSTKHLSTEDAKTIDAEIAQTAERFDAAREAAMRE